MATSRRSRCVILALICAAAFSSPCMQPEVSFAGHRLGGRAHRSAVVMQAKRNPMRAPTAYNLFIADNYEKFREAAMSQGKSPMKLAGEQWRSLSVAEKAKFAAAAEENALAIGIGKQRKALNGYNVFTSQRLGDETYRKAAEAEGLDPMSACARDWKALSEEEQAGFAAEAKAADPGSRGVKMTKTKKLSGYNLFVREKYPKGAKQVGGKHPLAAIAEQWQSLPDAEKDDYKERAAAITEMAGLKAPKTGRKVPKLPRKVTGYIAFVQANKGQDWKASGEKSFGAAMGAQWKALTDSEKQEWNNYAAGL